MAAALAALAFAGCGGSDSSGSSDAGATGGTDAVVGGTGVMTGGAGGTRSTAPDLQMCLDRGMMLGETADCTMCVCTMCYDQASNVYDNMDPTFSINAQNLIDCARMSCCKRQGCYCGVDAMGMVNLIECLATPMGPCKTQIEAAAGVMGAMGAIAPCTATTTTNACGAALALGQCVQGDSTAMPPITGKCPMCTMCE